MSAVQGHISTKPGHLEALRAKHATLSEKIEEEEKNPFHRMSHLRRLKAERLQLKDNIEGKLNGSS